MKNSQSQHTPSLPLTTQKSQSAGVLSRRSGFRDLAVFRVKTSFYKQKATKITNMIIITILALAIMILTGCVILLKTETKKKTELRYDNTKRTRLEMDN